MTLAGRRHLQRSAIFALAAALLVSGAPVAGAVGRMISVVVTSRDATSAADAVTSVGGRVDAPLPIVDGVLAHVPEPAVADLSRIAVVADDRPIHMQSASFGDGLASAYPAEVGATTAWSNGTTGAGVTVALIDTGVAPVADLATRVVASADLSPELTFTDGFGHGTFMAGLIAGNGASSNGAYTGVAPGAKLMSVKVASGDGSTSLGRVLLGVSLVDQSAAQFNVRVALLAIDSGSPLPPSIDPLSLALHRLWADGVLVVVPAGNGGTDGIASPGEDPMLLTAGSVNDRGTSDVTDDSVSSFTGRGPTRWGADKPDVAAPGEHLVSLRAPGSAIDVEHPTSRVGDAYFKGSGTSMSAAVTAGSAALLLSARPSLDPDQVKAMLMGTASAIPDGDVTTVGAGVVDASGAIAADAPTLPEAPTKPGNGPKFHIFPKDFGWYGNDAIGWRFLARQWGAEEWAARQWAADAWDAKFAARQWSDFGWDGRQWAETDWAARQWGARQWEARQWGARQWGARQWEGRQWAARQWLARQWEARAWASDAWMSRQWTSRQWTQDEWLARQWDARQWDARQWDARQWDARQWDARQWDGRQWEGRQWEARSWE